MSTRAGQVPAAQSTGKGALGTHDESKLFPSGNRAQFYGAPFWQARTSNRTGSGPALETSTETTRAPCPSCHVVQQLPAGEIAGPPSDALFASIARHGDE